MRAVPGVATGLACGAAVARAGAGRAVAATEASAVGADVATGRGWAVGIGRRVGATVGAVVGAAVGRAVGAAVGARVGAGVGRAVGIAVGGAVGATVARCVGVAVGGNVGAAVGGTVGAAVGGSVGAASGRNVGATVGAIVGAEVGGRLGIAVAGAAEATTASVRAVGSGDGFGLRIAIVTGAGDPVGEIFESSGLRGTPRNRRTTGRGAAAASAATAAATIGRTRGGWGAAVGSTRRTTRFGAAVAGVRSRVTRSVSNVVVSAIVDELASGALLDVAPIVRIAKNAPTTTCTRSDNTSAIARRRPYRSRRARDGVMRTFFAPHGSDTSRPPSVYRRPLRAMKLIFAQGPVAGSFESARTTWRTARANVPRSSRRSDPHLVTRRRCGLSSMLGSTSHG
jgi:hypothetical protein